MKQNLQPPATPLEMLSLFFPAGLLDYFDLVNHVSQETCFIFFLEEKPSIPQEHSHLHLHSKGFFRLSGNLWLVSFKISYLCLPLFYETRTTPSCHPSGCAYRQL